jgi:ATP-dependent Clp protease ATP-binding subunit ClpA
MTSNIASDKIMEFQERDEREKAVNGELKKYFKPEFLNRLDDIVIFNPLDLEAITSIVDILFRDIEKKLVERDISVSLSSEAKAYIAESGFDPVYGARPLKRALYDEVEDRLAELILKDKVREGSSVHFSIKEGKIFVEVTQ